MSFQYTHTRYFSFLHLTGSRDFPSFSTRALKLYHHSVQAHSSFTIIQHKRTKALPSFGTRALKLYYHSVPAHSSFTIIQYMHTQDLPSFNSLALRISVQADCYSIVTIFQCARTQVLPLFSTSTLKIYHRSVHTSTFSRLTLLQLRIS